jgi:hypothetical protein
MLKKRGEFLPFAATVGSDGEITFVATHTGDEHPLPTELIDQFIEILKGLASNGEIFATAICYDGRVSVDGKEKKDAITVTLEPSGAECVTIYMPYAKTLFGGYKYDPLFASAAQRQFFA